MLLALLAVLSTGACATSASRAGEQLHMASLELHDALQFGDYRLIAQRLPSALRTEFLARAYGVEKTLSVLELTTISMELAADGESARTLTRLSWYELPSTVVNTENVFIDWKRTGKGSSSGWLIERIDGGPLPIANDETGTP